MSFQALRHKLLEVDSSLTPVLQKFLIIAVSFAINIFMNRILDMQYTGIEEKIDLINSSLPA
jgi:hypothetical protein